KWEKPVLEALEYARQLKTKGDRISTNRKYDSICNLLSAWITAEGLDGLRVVEFSKAHAADYLDHCLVDRKVGPRTYNNNLRDSKIIFRTLQERGFIHDVPFQDFKYQPVGAKKRRNFTDQEARVVVQAIADRNRLLFYALVLQYACLIRPEEIRRLKFENIRGDHIL